MSDNYNNNQITRKDAKNCFVESLNDSFSIGKIHFAFATYNAQRVERFISWLPCIVEIEINGDFDNDWLNITFSNHQKINYLYNTGIENALLDLFKPKKTEDIE